MARYYTHRNGIIWNAEGRNPRTCREAEESASRLLDMAITEKDEEYARGWMRQLGDLLEAIRGARAYEAAHPVRLAA